MLQGNCFASDPPDILRPDQLYYGNPVYDTTVNIVTNNFQHIQAAEPGYAANFSIGNIQTSHSRPISVSFVFR